MNPDQDRLVHAPLEEVLSRLYPAPTLKYYYDLGLRQLAETYPATLPQSNRAPRGAGPKKEYLVALLIGVLQDPAMGRRFFEMLPAASRAILEALTWERRVNLATLEGRLGVQIAAPNSDPRLIYWQPFRVLPEHGFLVITRERDDSWGYGYGSVPPKKKDSALLLPDALRKAFKAFLPPPEGYELRPLEALPALARQPYSCADKAIADFRLVSEYIAQGHLKYTKAEDVAMPSLKTLRQMTGGGEFFEDGNDSDLALLRTRLLVGGLAFGGAKERENLLAHPDTAEPVRRIFEKVSANASLLHEEFLPHLAHSRNRWCQHDPHLTKELAAFYGTFPAGKWITWENIRSYHILRELRPSLFGRESSGLQASVTMPEKAWSTSVTIREDTEFALVSEPLLKGFAFLLAAFGLAEIAYGAPTHTTYRRPKKHYLTPYDGLGHVRLTPLGEFVFGQRPTFDMASGPPIRSPIRLDAARLLATTTNPDKLTELSLAQFMEKLAPGCYRMTPKSFLGGCGCREEVEARIRLFRRVVTATPPAVWETFFQQTLDRIAPLSLEPDYVVLQVSADEEIRRLIAADPVLREIALKVEGLRIAVHRDNLRKLAKRLEQSGYLSPIARILADR